MAAILPLTWNAESNNAMLRKIQLNRYRQRVDEQLRPWDDLLVKQLKQRMLCARHFLTGCEELNCSKSHDGSITDEEKRALMRIARGEPCGRGTSCYDRGCISGHHCVYDGRCTFGSSCRYGPEMHGIDKEVSVVC